MMLAKRLDLSRHARMLRGLSGSSVGVALCGPDGSWVWSDGVDRSQATLAPFLEAIAEEGCEAGRGQDADTLLAWAPVRDRQGDPLAWLISCENAATPSTRGLAEALQDVAACIETEAQLHAEVADLGVELGERNEEVNLVYTVEERAQALAGGVVGARALLRDFAHCLNVEIAALQIGDQFVYALRDPNAVPNYDLVLTELRNHLAPFLTISGKPFILNEPADVRREYLFANLPYRALGCPVQVGNHIKAILFLVRRPDGPLFTNGDRNLAGVIAHQTARILHSQNMLEDLRRFGDQLAEALIRAVEVKDPYTRGHSERVQLIAKRLAFASELPEPDVEAVSWGALLHDVGKIGVPDRILCKAGKLTAEEYTLIQTHPERSYDILRYVDQIDPRALDAARYHQEKFDGTGYPHGLRGLEIPVHARVTAVADTYDAITSSRAYRPGRDHDKAMAIIAESAGTQLDPKVVTVFERICSEGTDWLPATKAHEDD